MRLGLRRGVCVRMCRSRSFGLGLSMRLGVGMCVGLSLRMRLSVGPSVGLDMMIVNRIRRRAGVKSPCCY